MAVAKDQITKKSLLLNPQKIAKLRDFFKADSDSQAVRQAIDETLAYKDALRAARLIQSRNTFARNGRKDA